MPTKAGVSGTAHRYMTFGRMFGLDVQRLRLTMLGAMLPMRMHSFHEIMTASRGEKVEYEPTGREGPYHVPPMSRSELEKIAGSKEKFDELNVNVKKE